MAPTLSQLHRKFRSGKKVRPNAPAFKGAPHRRGVIYQIAVTSPRKPNSARRTYAKLHLSFSGKRVFAKIPGVGKHSLQEHSKVLVRGHGPKDTPGVNYHLIRGKLDFSKLEPYGRRKRRSKYGVKKYT
jgi:small subunit ribosomal protein S12